MLIRFQVLLFIACTQIINETNSSICTQLNGFNHCYLTVIIQFDNNHLFAQLNSFKYSRWLNSYIWPIDGAQWTQEQWQWRGIHIPPKLQNWNLIMRSFSVKSRTFVMGWMGSEMKSAYSTAPADWVEASIDYWKLPIRDNCQVVLKNRSLRDRWVIMDNEAHEIGRCGGGQLGKLYTWIHTHSC